MKATSSILVVLGSLVVANAIPLDFLGRDPDPLSGAYPLGECQGDCDKDEHCGYGLVCLNRAANAEVPGCEGGKFEGTTTSYCIQDPAGRSNENGATVDGVTVVDAVNRNEVAGAEKEDSSAGSVSMLFSAGVASAAVFGLF